MKGTIFSRKYLHLMFLLIPVAFLPSCGWLREQLGGGKETVEKKAQPEMLKEVDDGSEVLVTMGGKSIITAKSLDEDFDQLLEENPQVKAMLPMMPDIKQNFLNGMVSQAVVDKYVEEHNIDQQVAYQNDLARMMRSVRRMLNTKYFGEAHPVEVGDAEVREFYDKHKDMIPDLIVSRGGVNTVGVSFATEEEAKSFLEKVKGKSKDFAKIVEAEGLKDKMRDFKLVNAQSVGIDFALKNKIVALNKFPAIELIKADDKTFWVANAVSKEESKYKPFKEVKEHLAPHVAKEKKMEAFEKEIEKLKAAYNVVVDTGAEYFKTQQEEKPEEGLFASDNKELAPDAEAKVAQDNQATKKSKDSSNTAKPIAQAA